MRRRIEDAMLTFLQRRCKHPGEMVAVDILEGSGGKCGVSYCRRCGAVRLKTSIGTHPWRRPEPNLWRG